MNPKIQIGCSAFDNGFWSGVFYPTDLPRKDYFHFYCQYFSTFEINSTFYNFPTVRILQNWSVKSPADFLFFVKAPQLITHENRFVDSEVEIKKLYDVCAEGLAEKLGGVLFQLPPSFTFTEERLQLIVNSLDPQFKNVVEFRHPSWWIPEVFNTLENANIIFCSVSYPNLSSEIIQTGKSVYIRLHGDEKLFYSGYSPTYLSDLHKNLKSRNLSEVYIYFNNTASIAGILNALEMNVLTGQ